MALRNSTQSLPPPQLPSAGVLLAYFNIYLEHEKKIVDKKSHEGIYKEEEKKIAAEAPSSYFNMISNFLSSSVKSIKNTVKSLKQNIQSAIDHVTGTDEILKKIYSWLLNTLAPENPNNPDTPAPENWTWEKWIEFAIELRHKGAEAQQAKTTSGQSRCCEIFFALADYILVAAMQHKEGQRAYAAKIESLYRQLEEAEKNVLTNSGLDTSIKPDAAKVKKLNEEIDKCLLNLCYLGDQKAIIKASTRVDTKNRVGLLDHLYSVSQKESELGIQSCCHEYPEFNDTRPYVLLWYFARICFFDRKFSAYTDDKCYTDFIHHARIDYQAKMIQKKEKEEEEKRKEKINTPPINASQIEPMPGLETIFVVGSSQPLNDTPQQSDEVTEPAPSENEEKSLQQETPKEEEPPSLYPTIDSQSKTDLKPINEGAQVDAKLALQSNSQPPKKEGQVLNVQSNMWNKKKKDTVVTPNTPPNTPSLRRSSETAK